MKIRTTSSTPSMSAIFSSRVSDSSDRVRSGVPSWNTPKSARPMWIRSSAVLRTPAAIDSRATISPTPIAIPAAVSVVLAGRRQRFRQTKPAQVMAPIFRHPRRRRYPHLVAISRDAVLAALERVIDPELGRPVTELDMVRDVEIDGGAVSVTIGLTIAGCPLRSSFSDQVAEHVGAVPGVEATRVGFDVMTPDERAALTTKLRGGVAGRSKGIAVDRSTRVLAIASGKGGVGKSTLTTNLAAAFAALDYRTGVLDADIYGYSIPHLLGITQRPVAVDDMIVPPVRNGLKLMSIGFFLDDNSPVMWRGPMLHRALEQFLSDVHWGELDVLLVDMPPGTGDVAISLGQLLPRAEAIVVTTPQPLAQDVAARAALMAQKTNMRLLGVVENMTSEVFGSGGGAQLAEDLGTALLGTVPLDAALRESADAGEPLVWTDPDAAASRAVMEIAEAVLASGREPGRGITKELPLVG